MFLLGYMMFYCMTLQWSMNFIVLCFSVLQMLNECHVLFCGKFMGSFEKYCDSFVSAMAFEKNDGAFFKFEQFECGLGTFEFGIETPFEVNPFCQKKFQQKTLKFNEISSKSVEKIIQQKLFPFPWKFHENSEHA